MAAKGTSTLAGNTPLAAVAYSGVGGRANGSVLRRRISEGEPGDFSVNVTTASGALLGQAVWPSRSRLGSLVLAWPRQPWPGWIPKNLMPAAGFSREGKL